MKVVRYSSKKWSSRGAFEIACIMRRSRQSIKYSSTTSTFITNTLKYERPIVHDRKTKIISNDCKMFRNLWRKSVQKCEARTGLWFCIRYDKNECTCVVTFPPEEAANRKSRECDDKPLFSRFINGLPWRVCVS